jgi:hypothetical protein
MSRVNDQSKNQKKVDPQSNTMKLRGLTQHNQRTKAKTKLAKQIKQNNEG